MCAIHISGDKLVWEESAVPELTVGSVRIEVRASAVNRADLVQRQGGYPPPPGASAVLGLECAGQVIEVGEGVSRVKVGDTVCALLAGGGYAEQVVAPAGQVLKVPEGMDAVVAAALPEVFATAYLNLYMEGGLKKGERVLVHAGASGVGTAATQLCRATGNPAYVTVGSEGKIEQCLRYGALDGVNRHTIDLTGADSTFAERVATWTDGAGFDVVLDPVGASYLQTNLQQLNIDGRLVIIGLMGGVQTEVNLGLLLMKRLRVIGSTLRARPVAAKAEVIDALEREVWPWLVDGTIVPVVEKVFPIEQADAAHALMATNTTVGKILLEVPR